ncbi:hypothetical protein E2C01_096338 [Portunus trituberculatus]|uniref:Uncharacterized protein n=1 Tax=Portunus trituberculatus TaxID=210409 RepID=A0A5B7K2R5_PORTR|nr:hypothetical protein [Portunus trituberculatus]
MGWVGVARVWVELVWVGWVWCAEGRRGAGVWAWVCLGRAVAAVVRHRLVEGGKKSTFEKEAN